MATPSDLDSILINGANSFLDPRLPVGTYCRGWNITVRGGVAQTRPGTQWFVNLPEGKFQGAEVFEPQTGFTEIVAVVDGKAYSCQYPFQEYRQLEGIQFYPYSDTVYIAVAEQSVEINTDGSLTLITPKRVLVFQDGVTAPAYYDGYASGHLSGVDKTPVGTVMLWSGNRLWVARKNRVFASDYGNPFSFVEQFYLGGADSFLLAGDVTAMGEVPNINQPLLLVFTADDTTAFQSGILSRNLWLTTPNFQHTVFPGIGCVSHRSVAVQAGWLYWYSQRGLQNLNTAQSSLVTSTMLVADNEMAFSKNLTDAQLNQIAIASHDNYLVVSVPYAGTRNAHTWVMDTASIQTLTQEGSVIWASVWTGFQPAEWVSINSGSKDRLFGVSVLDKEVPGGVLHKNALLEFFREERTDSGQDIECAVELRVMSGGTPTLKMFDFAYMSFSEIVGEVDFALDWKGLSRGQYKRCMTKKVRAAQGSFRRSENIGYIQAFAPQFRRLVSEQVGSTTTEVAGSSRSLESKQAENRDWGFQFLVSWCGRAALRSIEPVFAPDTENQVGECSGNETVEVFSNAFRYDGVSAALVAVPPPTYTETVTFTGYARGFGSTVTATATSNISATAAVKQARQKAEAQVDVNLVAAAPPVLGI